LSGRNTTSRRSLFWLVAAPLAACVKPAAARPRLVAWLGLEGEEAGWLEALDNEQARALLDALEQGEAESAALLLTRVLRRRSRLFTYVGYPEVADHPTICDGLLKG
jgi:DNA-binding GntR family transcriptional regulator